MININNQNYESQPLTEDQSKIFISLAMMNDEQAEIIWKQMIKEEIFSALLVQKRCEVFCLNVPSKAKIFATTICQSHGQLVTFLVDILEMDNNPTFEQIANNIYPFGFYSEKGFENRWDFLKENKSVLKHGDLI